MVKYPRAAEKPRWLVSLERPANNIMRSSNIICSKRMHLCIPVIEGILNELKGHVHKDSLAKILLLFVALVQNQLGQVRIFPYQHPHWGLQHLMGKSQKPPECHDKEEPVYQDVQE